MNGRQKEVQTAMLLEEERVLKRLKQVYAVSLRDVTETADELQKRINALSALEKNVTNPDELARIKSMKQAKVYQKRYQEALKSQISGILDTLQEEQFKTLDEYLQRCYEQGFVGAMYDMHGQGVPVVLPPNPEAVVRAVQLDSPISERLYRDRLGEDVAMLKRKITAQVSRGISSGMTYAQIAKQLSSYTTIGYNRAARIARTEGHRLQVQSAMDACTGAKAKGADVVKQWDAALDARTRESHRNVDGEIRELEDAFSNGLMYPGDPAGGASEVVNCRCSLLQRARWALDEAELQTLKDRASYYGLDKAENFKDFEKKYLKSSRMSAAGEINWGPARTKITPAEYKECMRYAREKGIELSGFRHFEGKIETIKELVDDAKSVADLYPGVSSGRKKLTIELDSTMSSKDYAVTRGRIISINANAFRDTDRLESEYEELVGDHMFVAGTNYRAIIKHEMGHVVANTYDLDLVEIAKKVLETNRVADILEYCNNNLSEYSAAYADCSEIISECFASVYNSSIDNTFALNFVKECDRIISEVDGR